MRSERRQKPSANQEKEEKDEDRNQSFKDARGKEIMRRTGDKRTKEVGDTGNELRMKSRNSSFSGVHCGRHFQGQTIKSPNSPVIKGRQRALVFILWGSSLHSKPGSATRDNEEEGSGMYFPDCGNEGPLQAPDTE